MTPRRTPMSRVDTAWLRLDSDVNRPMVVGLWLLQPAVTLAALSNRLRNRLLKIPRFRQKAVQGTLGAEWVDEEAFDLHRHVVRERLVCRRGQSARAALQSRVGELISQPLDRAHPLWQFHLVEQYDNGSAVIVRVHHCMADGIALSAVLMSLMDDGAEAPGPEEIAQPHLHDRDLAQWLNDSMLQPLTALAIQAIEGAGDGVVRSLAALERPRQTLGRTLALGQAARQIAADAATIALMADDAPTRFRGPLDGHKCVAWSEPLPLEHVKAVGKALACSVNDVLVACAAGAIGGYLRDLGDDTRGQEIRAMVPVNLRPLDEAWSLGNRFGLAPLLVPIGIEHPVARVYAVHARMSELKGHYQPLLAYAMMALTGSLTQGGQDLLSNHFLDKTTAVMTNVPGPQRPLRLCGSTLRQATFWAPLSGHIGLGVSIMSYAGGVQLGLITDRQRCTEPQAVLDRFAPEFEKLLLMTLMMPWAV
ncbi:wax ester/triacylglycerol synthase family O-acyltransferase [Ideonella sp.]|uniref:wax ester/triacylglycerol synthase family O-acyltransferase n=1 Tax=Ideonella sp. TaxID=1929293 RepID=UPI0035B2BAA3